MSFKRKKKGQKRNPFTRVKKHKRKGKTIREHKRVRTSKAKAEQMAQVKRLSPYFTQKQVAEKLGVSVSTVKRISAKTTTSKFPRGRPRKNRPKYA